MSRLPLRLLPLLLAPALVAGCATPYGAGGDPYGDPYGGGYGAPPYPSQGRHAVGTVIDVDPSRGRMLVSADSRYGPPQIEIAFGPQTQVVYQGRAYSPADIERGDRVDVQLIDDGGGLAAGRIDVLRNVRAAGYGDTGAGGGVLDGLVGRVDTGSGTLELTSGGYGGRRQYVRFDGATRFEYGGQRVSPEQLEPGDGIRIEARPRNGELYAERVVVVSNARSR